MTVMNSYIGKTIEITLRVQDGNFIQIRLLVIPERLFRRSRVIKISWLHFTS
jgi:hypothetical protein